jgi:glycosyltransferase involved in cell wall biosynthesis
MTLPITAILLTFNEEIHIARCIERLRDTVARIVVVDSYSTDKTCEIARAMGAEVLQNKWRNYADQFQWGVDQAAETSGWIMRIDCDEFFEPAALAELTQRLPTLGEDITAIEFRRKVFFREKWIRWGGYYDARLTRIWRAGAASIEQRWMDEHIVVDHGEIVRFTKGDLVDENLKDIGWWTDKHNGYATRQMIDFINLEYGLFPVDARLRSDPNAGARWKRFLRNKVYAGAPLYFRAVLYFIQRYFFRLGILDGRLGFVWHFLQGFWFFVLMDAKIDEARIFIRQNGLDAFKLMLAERYGITDLAPVERISA